jgi:hypothetical protein
LLLTLRFRADKTFVAVARFRTDKTLLLSLRFRTEQSFLGASDEPLDFQGVAQPSLQSTYILGVRLNKCHPQLLMISQIKLKNHP